MTKTVKIRGEEHSVMQAINRQVAHYNYHIGQIVLLARHYAGANWKSLTVPKNKSKEFNADVASGKKSQR
jgi:D-tyrosyl-tRNA(Tyr) deacylase